MQGGLVDWDAPLLSALVKQFKNYNRKMQNKSWKKSPKMTPLVTRSSFIMPSVGRIMIK
jgi:hypothetical protein